MTDTPITKTRFQVGGMDCAACSTKIETAVSRIPGVTEVTSSFTSGAMSVGHTGEVPRLAIERAVKNLGYSIAPAGSRAAPPPLTITMPTVTTPITTMGTTERQSTSTSARVLGGGAARRSW